MTATITIAVDEIRATLTLRDQTAPQTAAHLLGSIPDSATVVHATRSGNCASVTLADGPTELPVEGQVSMYYPGMVAFDPSTSELVLAYGQGQARSPYGTHWVTYAGDVTEGLEQLAAKLQEARDQGVFTVHFDTGESA